MEQQALNQGPYILLIYGIPGSGKSTFCQQFRKVIPETTIISGDVLQGFLQHLNHQQYAEKQQHIISIYQHQLKQMIQKQSMQQIAKLKPLKKQLFDQKKWKASRDFMKNNISKFWNNNKMKKFIIFEDDFLLDSQRRPYRKFCRENKIKYIEIFLECDIKTAVQNNEKRQCIHVVKKDVINTSIQKIQFHKRMYCHKMTTKQIMETSPTQFQALCHNIIESMTILPIQQQQTNDKHYETHKNEQKQLQLRKLISQLISTDSQIFKISKKQLTKKQKAEILTKVKKNLNGKNGKEQFLESVKEYLKKNNI